MCVVVAAAAALAAANRVPQAKGHPKVSVRATPLIGIAPVKVTARAELVGGADDDQDFYCPRVEWTWADQAVSNDTPDCDPYVPGKSEIKRLYSAEHTYEIAGNFDLTVRFYQGKKVVGLNRTTVRVSGLLDRLIATPIGPQPPARR